MEENSVTDEYRAINWNNFGRRLSANEYHEITQRIAGLHFAKDTLNDDPVAMQALYAAEALQRELDILLESSPFEE